MKTILVWTLVDSYEGMALGVFNSYFEAREFRIREYRDDHSYKIEGPFELVLE